MDQNIPIEKCEKCGCCNLKEGFIGGYAGSTGFYRKGSKTILSTLTVDATACKDCGAIFNLKLRNPEKL